MELLDIAKHCEDAVGPDRSIDGLIAHAVGCSMPDDPAGWPPRYTASLDAALTLADGIRGLSLNRRSNPDMGGRDWIVSAGSIRSAARSWALAVCAVGLRDRAKWPLPVVSREG